MSRDAESKLGAVWILPVFEILHCKMLLEAVVPSAVPFSWWLDLSLRSCTPHAVPPWRLK
jgi:hypothetical protein